MKYEILGNKSLGWEKAVVLRGSRLDLNNTHPFSPYKDNIPDFVESKKPSAATPGTDWKSNLLIRTALIWLGGLVSPPVFFSLMGRNDIFSSNLRSSEEKNSVSDLGGELREFGACKIRHRAWNQILRRSLKWNLNWEGFIVPFPRTESLDSLLRDVDQVQLFL